MIPIIESVVDRYLTNLVSLLNKLEQSDIDHKAALHARLVDGSFPLIAQSKIVCNFAFRIVSAIQQKQFSEPVVEINSVGDLIQYANMAKFELRKLNAEIFIEKLLVDDSAGLKAIKMPLIDYVFHFALPNLFFHLSNVYNILKQLGIDVSKGDFDGIHFYPPEFSWE